MCRRNEIPDFMALRPVDDIDAQIATQEGVVHRPQRQPKKSSVMDVSRRAAEATSGARPQVRSLRQYVQDRLFRDARITVDAVSPNEYPRRRCS
jgi:hypothetical protein